MAGSNCNETEREQEDSTVGLTGYLDNSIRAKLSCGTEATGILKESDPILSLVLDGTAEQVRGEQYSIVFSK